MSAVVGYACDGWYMHRQDAEEVADAMRREYGLVNVGVVCDAGGRYGVLYWPTAATASDYPNHLNGLYLRAKRVAESPT